MLVLPRDHFAIAIMHVLHGMANYYNNLRNKELFKNASNCLSALTDLAWYVQELMVGTLLEFAEVVEEHAEDEVLPNFLGELIRSLCIIFKEMANSLAEFWEALVTTFPLNKDVYGNRFSCKNNSFLTSMESIKSKHNSSAITWKADRDVLSNLSELLLIYTLECSFVLITSYDTITSEHRPFKIHNKFNSNLEKLMKTLTWFRSRSTECTENSDQRVHTYLSETYGMTTAHVNGALVPIENRFSIEYKLYDNSSAMVGIGTDILKLLENIRSEAFKLVTNDAKLLQPHGDENYCILESAENTANTPAMRFKTLQTELEAKMNVMITYSKLEIQLLARAVELNSKVAKVQSVANNKESAEEENGSKLNESDDASDLEDSLSLPNSSSFFYESGAGKEERLGKDPERLDELYELVPGNEAENENAQFFEAQAQSEDDEVHEARQVVLEQLKTVLKPRQEAMKSREEEAYRRAYGERKEDTFEEPDTSDDPVRSKRKRKKKPSLSWGNEDEYVDNEVADTSYVEDDEINSGNENNFLSEDFKSKLDKILKFGNTAGSND